jgi:hypothetical protein
MTTKRQQAWGIIILLLSCVALLERLCQPTTYMTCREIAPYFEETLELRWGRFKYWSSSDADDGRGPTYPLRGSYVTNGDTIALQCEGIPSDYASRTLDRINGVPVLWRKDGLAAWRNQREIFPYGVLIRTSISFIPFMPAPRPTIRILGAPDSSGIHNSPEHERSATVVSEVELLLDLSRMGESDSSEEYLERRRRYKLEIQKIRINLTPKIVSQLIGCMDAKNSRSAEADRALADLFLGFGKDQESRAGDKEEDRARRLEMLIDSLAFARDRQALEKALITLLRFENIQTISLEIPRAGVRLRIEVYKGILTMGSGNLEGSLKQPISPNWEAEISDITSACQDWLRQRIKK